MSYSVSHNIYMRRCFDLARLGAGKVSPNPMVGAVLVYANRIIGEGYHAKYGGAHAEVMTMASVQEEDRHLIGQSRLYVSLEPCNIHGNTPPCTDLILKEKIPHLIIANSDQTPGVQGSGLDRLRAVGVKVEEGILRKEGFFISQLRNIFVEKKRPYVVLKYAQTADGFLAPKDRSSYWLTNSFCKTLVHKWRTETDAILVGSGTVRADNPALTNRLYPGKQPLRVVLDRNGTLPTDLKLFDGHSPTLVFSEISQKSKDNISFIEHDFGQKDWLKTLLHHLAKQKTAHLTVEGGAWLLEQFISQGLWDEARVFTSPHQWSEGIAAPKLGLNASKKEYLLDDLLEVYYKGQ